jgi:hypothetical protein
MKFLARTVPAVSGLLLSSCMCTLVSATGLEVTGVCASYLSSGDIVQIARLANSYPEIRKPIYSIHMTGQNWADVESGHRPKKRGDKYSSFQVHRVNGLWYMLKDSIISDNEFESVVVTG